MDKRYNPHYNNVTFITKQTIKYYSSNCFDKNIDIFPI